MTLEPLPPQQGVSVVRVTGELDVLTTRPLHHHVAGAATGQPLVLDLTGVTFFDSSAVQVVNRLARDYAGRAGFRVVAPPGGRARRVLDIIGLGSGIVSDSLDEAVAQLRPHGPVSAG